jgi:KaiC/GvpD/RAD55 family RecA-like ATPase
MNTTSRFSAGIEGFDALLGGGLLPGTLTVVVGSAGIGKTQLGLQFLHAGREQEGTSGIVFDMSSRGDSQNHADYARRMFGWELDAIEPELHVPLDAMIERPLEEGDLLSNANTVIYMGKIREGKAFRRAMYVGKHRGSACTDEIIPYRIDDRGVRLDV